MKKPEIGAIFLLTLSVLGLSNGQTYEATIAVAGYKGSVTFQPTGNDMNVTVHFTVGAAIQSLDTFEITNFPAVFGQLRSATEVCNNLGATIASLPGVANGTNEVVPGLSADNIFNRGLLVTSTTNNIRLCATIIPTTENVKTFHAKFIGPIAGEVWIRQRQTTPGLFVYSDLSYATDRASPTATTKLNLIGYSGESINAAFDMRCDSLSAPNSFDLLVNVGNSATASGTSAVFFPDTSDAGINLSLNQGGNIIACTNLYEVNSKTVTTTISWLDIRGTVTMTQSSPFDVTTTAVSLSGITSVPAGFHVHEFPVPQRLTSSEQRCSGNNVGGHFNPYGVVIANSPANAEGTSDQYEIGDLSGKYGALTSNTVDQTYTDWNLPLFGVNSVAGRSIVIHMPNGDRWVCASIGYPGPVTTAIVKFKTPVYGYMLLRQDSSNIDADTSVFMEFANMNGTTTTAHNYHVHVDPIGEGCASAGPHYDPAGLASATSYTQMCSPNNPLHCELGDLSGRHGGVDIGPKLRQNKKMFVTDINLPLTGSHGIIGRSIVIHVANAGAPRLTCANITLLRPTIGKTIYDTWKGDDSSGTVTGQLTFEQDSEYDRTRVYSTVTGLGNMASGYHIHVLPVSEQAVGIDQCSSTSVEGHFNPFGITTIPPPTSTYDKYEVGDLSNKYGLLDNMNDITLTSISDNNLPMATGAVSAADRSIVIHTPDARWKCNTFQIQPSDSTGHVITAEAQFVSGPVLGYVTLRQVVYEDGSASLTSIIVSLLNVDTLTASLDHNWHIHIDPVLQEDECSIALGHYDPYMAEPLASNYSAQCNKYNPLACEVGDISGKQAKYDIDSSREIFLDEDVPLHTDKSVLGRSIVFHTANAGSPRLACANILPPTAYTYTLAFTIETAYDHYRFTNAVSAALGISRLRVVVLHNSALPVSGKHCSKVMVHIAGGGISPSVESALLDGTASGLSPYIPTSKCMSEKGATVVGSTELDDSGSNGVKMNLSITLVATIVTALMQKLLFY